MQACNQLGALGVAKNFLEVAQIFFNYVQNF